MHRRRTTRVRSAVVTAMVVTAGGALLMAPAMADQPDPVAGAVGVGDATATTVNPDVGRHVDFGGILVNPTLGVANYQGGFSLPGFVASGRAVGDMVITTDGGSMSLHLESADVGGFAPAEGDYTFTWTLTGVTGGLGGLGAQGTLDITLIALSAPAGLAPQPLIQVVRFGDPTGDTVAGVDAGALTTG